MGFKHDNSVRTWFSREDKMEFKHDNPVRRCYKMGFKPSLAGETYSIQAASGYCTAKIAE